MMTIVISTMNPGFLYLEFFKINGLLLFTFSIELRVSTALWGHAFIFSCKMLAKGGRTWFTYCSVGR